MIKRNGKEIREMKKRQWLEDITGSMTHEEAAQKAGVERSTYTKAVNGYPVAIRTAKKIASAFGFDCLFLSRCM